MRRAALSIWMLSVTVVLAEPAGREAAPGFELQDQHGSRHTVSFPKERVSVLALADRKGSDQLENWMRPLYTRYGSRIDILGVAKLAGVPAVMRPPVRALFRNGLDYPVMLDWTGSVSTDYSAQADVANILVLSPDGRIAYRFNGKADPAELERCFTQIDGLLSMPTPRAE